MRSILPFLLIFLSQTSAADGKRDWNKVMGDIDIQEGEAVGNVRSVNGDIELEDNSSAESVETTNGRLRVGRFVSAEKLKTVNGSIRAGRSLEVTGDIRTVNGSIRLEEDSQVGESVATVNGSIELSRTRVGEDVKTTNGDIELEGSVVEGDIIFEKVNYSRWNQSYPTLKIDAVSEVRGDIYLRRKVKLDISDDANIGEIVREYESP